MTDNTGMATVQIDDFSLPIFIDVMQSLNSMLDKGAEHAKQNGFDVDRFVQQRLAVDMHPLEWHVLQVNQTIYRTLAGEKYIPDNKQNQNDRPAYQRLKDICHETLVFLTDTYPASSEFTKSPAKKSLNELLTQSIQNTEITINGYQYITKLILPNLYFHLAGAYNIFRVNGVKINKLDFLRI